MRKTRPIISFEKSFLDKLVNDEKACVELQEQKYHLALHPFHLTNINKSIKDILGQGIAKYDNKLHGILLGYENIKLLTEGTITDDSCFVHIDVSANFFLFKPEVDKVLVGVINKKSQDHVGCLVHETFNVSIPKPEEEDVNDWMGSKVEVGDEILLKITFLKLEARLPYIRGELVKIPTTIDNDNPDETLSDSTSKKRSKSKKSKKKKQEVSEDEVPRKERLNGDVVGRKSEEASIDEVDISLSKKKSRDDRSVKKKHKKSNKDLDISLEDNSIKMYEDEVILHKSIKHKKKKSEEECENVDKTKKKEKKFIEDELTIDFDNTGRNQLYGVNEVIGNDMPKKKKKKKKEIDSIEENVNNELDNSRSTRRYRDSEEIDGALPRKKKKKKKENDSVMENINEVTSDLNNSRSKNSNREDEVTDNDSPRKKKKKKKDDDYVKQNVTEVTSDIDNSRSKKRNRDGEVTDNDSPRKKKKKKRDNDYVTENVNEVTSEIDNSRSKKRNRDGEVTDNDSARKKKKKKKENDSIRENVNEISSDVVNISQELYRGTVIEDDFLKMKMKKKHK